MSTIVFKFLVQKKDVSKSPLHVNALKHPGIEKSE